MFTDITWRYVNRQTAAINALKDYHNMECIIETTPQELRELEDEYPRPSSARVDGIPGVFNPKAGEDAIIRHIERIDTRKRKYYQALEYMTWFNPVWETLSEDERWILETTFLQGESIEAVCEHFCVERSAAYERKRKALDRFADLLYGK